MNMKKAMTTVGFLGACGYILAGTLEIQGKAELCLPPDGMRIEFSLEATDLDMVKSKDLFAQMSRSVMQALKDVGVSTNDIVTSDFKMSPLYHFEKIEEEMEKDVVDENPGKLKKVTLRNSRDRRVFDGYRHSMWYTVTSDFDRDRLEKIYHAVVKNGVGKDLRFDFFLRNPHLEQAKVRRQAVDNAKSMAEELCDAAGARICGIQKIDYNYSPNYDDLYVSGAAPVAPDPHTDQADDAPVFPELKVKDIRVSDSVKIIWEIK